MDSSPQDSDHNGRTLLGALADLTLPFGQAWRDAWSVALVFLFFWLALAALDLWSTYTGLRIGAGYEANPLVSSAVYWGRWDLLVVREIIFGALFGLSIIFIWPMRRHLIAWRQANGALSIIQFFWRGFWEGRPPYWRIVTGKIGFRSAFWDVWDSNFQPNLTVLLSMPALLLAVRGLAVLNNLLLLLPQSNEWIKHLHLFILWLLPVQTLIGYVLLWVILTLILLFPLAYYLTLWLIRRDGAFRHQP